MRDFKKRIVSIEYSMEVGNETLEMIWEKDKDNKTLSSKLFSEIPGINSVRYPIDLRKKICIGFSTNSFAEFDPKYNVEIWRRIASIIEDHINK